MYFSPNKADLDTLRSELMESSDPSPPMDDSDDDSDDEFYFEEVIESTPEDIMCAVYIDFASTHACSVQPVPTVLAEHLDTCVNVVIAGDANWVPLSMFFRRTPDDTSFDTSAETLADLTEKLTAITSL